VDVVALASIRATKEATVRRGGDVLECIVGAPEAGQRIAGETFDGTEDVAVFPGDLPADPESVLTAAAPVFQPLEAVSAAEAEAWRFVRFRPPLVAATGEGVQVSLPHIRLDRALQFLIGDRLR
jgi:predicted YcjX-like family ATPase